MEIDMGSSRRNSISPETFFQYRDHLKRHLAIQQAALAMQRTPPLSDSTTARTVASDEPDNISPIDIHINTSLKVSSNNNIISLTDSPADHANAIAKAVVKAIEENSTGRCGIPMLDPDGVPRPIHIQVEAGITVEGDGNVIGRDLDVIKALQSTTIKTESD